MSAILVDNAEIRKRVSQYLKEKGIETKPLFILFIKCQCIIRKVFPFLLLKVLEREE